MAEIYFICKMVKFKIYFLSLIIILISIIQMIFILPFVFAFSGEVASQDINPQINENISLFSLKNILIGVAALVLIAFFIILFIKIRNKKKDKKK